MSKWQPIETAPKDHPMSATLDTGPESGYGGNVTEERSAQPRDQFPCGRISGIPSWYVIETHFQAEKRVARELSERDYVHYLPMQIAKRRDKKAARGWSYVHVPMFGNYLFFQCDVETQPWTPARYAPGVRRIFMNAQQRPIPLPVGAVERLIAEAPKRLELPDVKLPAFPTNTLLRITEGPFASFPARCIKSDQFITEVEAQLFGRSVVMVLRNASLEMWEPTLGIV